VNARGVREVLARHGLALHRERGQNFLIDAGLADRLVTLAGVGPEDAVVEIGTGLGILTRALAARARRVVTIEVDAGLVRALRAHGGWERWKQIARVEYEWTRTWPPAEADEAAEVNLDGRGRTLVAGRVEVRDLSAPSDIARVVEPRFAR